MTYLLLARKYWKLIGLGVLCLLLAIQTVRLGHAENQRDKARFNLNECREGRKQDRQAYEDAQRKAAELNQAEVKRIVSEQDRINDKIASDYERDLGNLRRQLRDQAVRGQANRSPSSPDGTAPAKPDGADPLRLSSEELLRAAEIELQLMHLQNWVREQLKVRR